VAKDAETVVGDFFQALGTTLEENVAAYERYAAPGLVWDTGSRVLHSRDEAIAHLRAIPGEYGVEAFRANVLNIAAAGNVVLTERLDDLLRPDGSVILSCKVMGTFEVDGDQIVAWRDYYDTAALARQFAEAGAPLAS